MSDERFLTLIGRATNADGSVGCELRAIKVPVLESGVEHQERMAAFAESVSDNYSRWFDGDPVWVGTSALPFFEPNDMGEEED